MANYYYMSKKLRVGIGLIPSNKQKVQIADYQHKKILKPLSIKEFFKLGKRIYNNINKIDCDYETIVKGIKEAFTYGIQTTSGVFYNPDGSGIVVHNKGLKQEERILVKQAIGNSRLEGKIEEEDKELVIALTGLNLNLSQKIMGLFDWRGLCLMRPDKNPKKQIYKAVGINPCVCCDWLPQAEYPALYFEFLRNK